MKHSKDAKKRITAARSLLDSKWLELRKSNPMSSNRAVSLSEMEYNDLVGLLDNALRDVNADIASREY